MLRQTVTALSLLFACQLIGDLIARTLSLPIPGPVIGMVLLFMTLTVNKRTPPGLDRVTAPLLKHMSLLFIPAGAGVMLYVDLITAEWPAIIGAIVTSTLVALLTTAAVFRLLQSAKIADEPAAQLISESVTRAASSSDSVQGGSRD